jgi:hypothetical protein
LIRRIAAAKPLIFNSATSSDFNHSRLIQNLFASLVLFCGQVSDEILFSHKKGTEVAKTAITDLTWLEVRNAGSCKLFAEIS